MIQSLNKEILRLGCCLAKGAVKREGNATGQVIYHHREPQGPVTFKGFKTGIVKAFQPIG